MGHEWCRSCSEPNVCNTFQSHLLYPESAEMTADPTRLRVHLLGRFKVTTEGADPRVVQITAPRHRALLCYLLLQPGCAETRERLATLLWGNGSDQQARQSLRQSLLSLHKTFQSVGIDPISADRELVTIDATRMDSDVCEFQNLANSNDPGDLDRALAVYQGELLEGLTIELESFTPWLERERARLRSSAAAVFERAARLLQHQAGRQHAAMAAARRWVELDPADEAAQRTLIELLAKQQGRAAALSHATAVRQLVRAELDCELSPETVALIERIKVMPDALATEPASRHKPPEVVEIADATVMALSAPGQVTPALSPTRTPGATLPPAISARRSWRRWSVIAVTASLAGMITIALRSGPHSDAVATPASSAQVAMRSADEVRARVEKAVDGRSITPIVVLPFNAEAGSAAPTIQFARRISDDLIGTLSRVPTFRVIARTTSNKYAGQAFDIVTIGQELGVRYAVEGNVRSAGNKIRIDIALIDAVTRLQVWADRYERDENDGARVQEDIVRGLARQLQVTIMEVRGSAADETAGNAGTRETLFKAWAALNLFAFYRGGREGEQLFEEVLRVDPDNISALTGLGAFKTVAAMTRQSALSPEVLFEESEVLLNKALALNHQASLPYYFLGVRAMAIGRGDEALALYAKTLELNPSYAPAYGNTARVLLATGRLNEALEQVMYAIRLSPKDHYLGSWSLTAGRIHMELGNDGEAERWLTQAVREMPNAAIARAALAALLMLKGDETGATAQMNELKRIEARVTPGGMRKVFAGSLDATRQPKRLLEGLDKAFALAAAAH